MPGCDAPPRCGEVAVLGMPNAGKSTLINRLIGRKVSIVTHKAQTTQSQIRGVAIFGAAQAVLVDTPGIYAPGRSQGEALPGAAWRGLAAADLSLLLVDSARGINPRLQQLLDRYGERRPAHQPAALVLNKIDRVPRPQLLPLARTLNENHGFTATFMVSARHGSGLPGLADWIETHLPEGAWRYPPDHGSAESVQRQAEECTREKLMLRLHQEVPYEITVRTTGWEDTTRGGLRVEQEIWVARESHRRMVIGRGGATLAGIGRAARGAVAEMTGRPVQLFLRVRLRSGPAPATGPRRKSRAAN